MMPTECPVPPAARKRRSSTSTLPTPSPVRWKASEAPVTPPPMMTTSAVDVTFAQRRPPPQPRRRRRGGCGRPDGPSRASQRDLQADGSRPCPIVRERRGRDVLERETDGLEERDLVGALAAPSRARHQLSEFGHDVPPRDRTLAERDQEIARLGERRGVGVDDDAGAAD